MAPTEKQISRHEGAVDVKFIVRPYNADFGLLSDAIDRGLRIDGILVDANIMRRFHGGFDARLRGYVRDGVDLIIDNNLERARRPNFSQKATYRDLPYVASGLTLEHLNNEADRIARQVLDEQRSAGATLYTSPYLYLDADALAPGATERYNAQAGLIDAFTKVSPANQTLLSLAFSASPLTDARARARVVDLSNRVESCGLYLLIFNMDLSAEAEMAAVVTLLRDLRRTHSRIILSHGPAFVYCLEPHGVTDFASGINYMMTLNEEYLQRRDDIEGITHNYYLPHHLMKVTPQNALQLLNAGLMDPCPCPICANGVPFDTNPIRQHYLFARSEEARDVNARHGAAIREYLDQADRLSDEAADEEIPLIQAPVSLHWLRLLDLA